MFVVKQKNMEKLTNKLRNAQLTIASPLANTFQFMTIDRNDIKRNDSDSTDYDKYRSAA